MGTVCVCVCSLGHAPHLIKYGNDGHKGDLFIYLFIRHDTLLMVWPKAFQSITQEHDTQVPNADCSIV